MTRILIIAAALLATAAPAYADDVTVTPDAPPGVDIEVSFPETQEPWPASWICVDEADSPGDTPGSRVLACADPDQIMEDYPPPYYHQDGTPLPTRSTAALEPQGDIPPLMVRVADRWSNVLLTSGQLPTARYYQAGCSWVSTAPRSLRCHFDLTIRTGVIKRGWWDVRLAKGLCPTPRRVYEDRSGWAQLAPSGGCVRFSMRPDGFSRIPPKPDPAP